MKRNKIKNKFRNKDKLSTIDKIEQKIFKILKSLGLIILLFIWQAIPMIVLAIIGINYKDFSQFERIIYLFICDIILLIFLLFIYKKDIITNAKNYFNKNFINNIKTSLKYWVCGLVIMVISNMIISIITNGQLTENEEAIRNLIKMAPWYMAFQLMIYAHITEEIIFRKSIKEITNHKYIYPLISGLVFGGLHIISSLESIIDLLYLIPYSALGIAFAILYRKTDNIFSTITIHAIHNTLALILYLTTL